MSKERVIVRDTDGNSVTFSATVKESHRFALDITEHAVEVGSPVNDHARPRADMVTLEGLVTDLDSSSDGGQVTGEPSQDAVIFFTGLKSTPRVVELVTPRIVYDSMLMGNCEIPRKNSDGKAARFTIEFKEFRTVDLLKTVVQVKLGKKAKKGRQENKLTLPAPLQSAGVILLDKAKAAGGVGKLITGWLGK